MNLVRVLNIVKEINRIGGNLYVSQNTLRLDIDHPEKISAAIKKEITELKYDLISFLSPADDPIPQLPIQESYELSSAQRRLWVLSKFENGSYAYNMPAAIELKGDLDVQVFEEAFNKLIARHESLRTIFKENATGDVRQWILQEDNHNFKLNYQDLSSSNTENLEKMTHAIVNQEMHHVFDLEQGSLLRVSLLKKSNNSHVFVFVMHHIVSDGWSLNILIRDLLAYYNGLVNQKNVVLPKLTIQYKEYAAWQQANSKDANDQLSPSKAFWLNQFKGELPVLNMPIDYARPAIKTFNGGTRIEKTLNKISTQKLLNLTQDNGATLFMSLLASVNVLLSKYSGQTDIIIGSPIAGRDHIDLAEQIGFYINTLAFRTEFTPDVNFLELLSNVKEHTLKAYEFQNYSFDELLGNLNLKRDVSRNPLFDVMIILQNNEVDNFAKGFDGLEIQPFENQEEFVISKFELTFSFRESEDKVLVDVEYNSDLFKYETIDRLSNHLIQIITSLVEHPTRPISEISCLSQEEKNQLLLEFNDTKSEYPKEKTIIDLFEEQVQQTPDQIAVIVGEKNLTYLEVNEKANQLGDYLRKIHGIQPEDSVGLLLERSEWMVLAIWGVLKSGGAYVPIDPNYPQERIDYILKDSNAKVLINQNELEQFINTTESYNKNNLEQTGNSSNLAYTYYTSGSTGKPKGVLAEHRNVLSFFSNIQDKMGIQPGSKFLGITNYTFDPAVMEYVGSLINGIQVEIVPDYLPESIYNSLSASPINTLQITPSRLFQLIDYNADAILLLAKLDQLLIGGEAFTEKLLSILEPLDNTRILNIYGPTETTLWSTCYEVLKGKKITVGSPLNNDCIHILDNRQQLVPIGVIGEICISGDGVARGYLNRPELTAEKFIPNPFKEGTRLYKSGDLGRWMPDGTIEFMGRNDDQVKIRGHRIELGEIEGVLDLNKDIRECVVIARENETGEKYLIAYLQAAEELNVNNIRTHLKESLPDYMVPGYFIQLEEFPLTPNGKLDKKSLPNPDGSCLIGAQVYVAPQNEIESQLVKIWSDVLGIKEEKIGIHDDFFVLGGNSLKATNIISKISRKLSVQLKLNYLFSKSTVAEIADVIQSLRTVTTANKTEETQSTIEF